MLLFLGIFLGYSLLQGLEYFVAGINHAKAYILQRNITKTVSTITTILKVQAVLIKHRFHKCIVSNSRAHHYTQETI